MKKLPGLLSIAILMLLFSNCARTASGPPDLQPLAENQSIAVLVARALYHTSGTDQLFIHVRIVNRTGKTLGIDLRDRSSVVYPNQWGIYSAPRRTVIDEMRSNPKNLTPELNHKLVSDFQAGRLTPLKRAVDYYIPFDGAHLKEKDLAPDKYVIVSLDGELLFTDGENVGAIRLADVGDAQREIAIKCPPDWQWLPRRALVVGH